MRFLGIDYGTKRVGLAISDNGNIFALPLVTLPNNPRLLIEIKKIIEKRDVGSIVIGESRDFAGEKNSVMRYIEGFKTLLEKETTLPVYYEPEYMTSAQASRIQGKHALLDASAAALILQGYLDKQSV